MSWLNVAEVLIRLRGRDAVLGAWPHVGDHDVHRYGSRNRRDDLLDQPFAMPGSSAIPSFPLVRGTVLATVLRCVLSI